MDLKKIAVAVAITTSPLVLAATPAFADSFSSNQDKQESFQFYEDYEDGEIDYLNPQIASFKTTKNYLTFRVESNKTLTERPFLEIDNGGSIIKVPGTIAKNTDGLQVIFRVNKSKLAKLDTYYPTVYLIANGEEINLAYERQYSDFYYEIRSITSGESFDNSTADESPKVLFREARQAYATNKVAKEKALAAKLAKEKLLVEKQNSFSLQYYNSAASNLIVDITPAVNSANTPTFVINSGGKSLEYNGKLLSNDNIRFEIPQDKIKTLPKGNVDITIKSDNKEFKLEYSNDLVSLINGVVNPKELPNVLKPGQFGPSVGSQLSQNLRDIQNGALTPKQSNLNPATGVQSQLSQNLRDSQAKASTSKDTKSNLNPATGVQSQLSQNLRDIQNGALTPKQSNLNPATGVQSQLSQNLREYSK